MLTKEQIETRKRGLGGSDSAIILGASPFATVADLWADKMGISEPIAPTAAMERGTYLEPVAAQKYASMTSRKLQNANKTIFFKKNRLFFAHIDRKIVGEPSGAAPLEIKCPGLRVFAQARREGLPAYYQVQAQHYMMVMGAAWASIAVFNAEQWEMFYVDVERDDDIIEMIRSEGERFWRMHIETGIPPTVEATPLAKVDLPPLETDQKMVRIDHDEFAQAVYQLREAQQLKAAVEAMENDAKAKIIKTITEHNATAVEGAGARIYYHQHAGRSSFDMKSFQKAHPELKDEIAKFQKQGKPYFSLRPYWLNDKQLEE